VSQSSHRVATNTALLYLRTVLNIGVQIVATRVLLRSLGVVDFGIFSVVAGVVVLLSFLNAAMTSATQRFLSFHQGRDDLPAQQRVFAASICLHLLLAVAVVLLLLAFSGVVVQHVLHIPVARMEAARFAFVCMSLAVFSTIVVVPFTASINAHEDMMTILTVGITEILLKLVAAFSIQWFEADHLKVYACGMAAVAFITNGQCLVHAIRKYPECVFRSVLRPTTQDLKEIGSFAGWNLFGTLSHLGRVQGLAVILNVFFGPAMNAAYGVANQVTGQVNMFSSMMMRAINPQIMKSEGGRDRDRMLDLSVRASKFGLLLLGAVAVPLMFEMPSLLRLWLGHAPVETAMFCNLLLVGLMINQSTTGLQSAVQATGDIKRYEIEVGGILLLNLPIAYVMLRLGAPYYTILISYVGVELAAGLLKLRFALRLAGLRPAAFAANVYGKAMLPIAATALSGATMSGLLRPEGFWGMLLSLACMECVYLTSTYFLALARDERAWMNGFLRQLLGRARREKVIA